MRFDVLTLFPELFESYLSQSLLNLAIERQLVEVKLWNFRNWAKGQRKSVDDKPFGGGPGTRTPAGWLVEAGFDGLSAGSPPPDRRRIPAGGSHPVPDLRPDIGFVSAITAGIARAIRPAVRRVNLPKGSARLALRARSTCPEGS